MDQKKLLRNMVSEAEWKASRAQRDSIRGMMGRPVGERLDVAASMYLYAFHESSDDDDRSRYILMATTLRADIGDGEVARRVREFAARANLDDLGERIVRERLSGQPRFLGVDQGADRAEIYHYEEALQLSREPAFMEHEDEMEALRALLESMEPARAEHLSRLLSDLPSRTALLWEARWGRAAFPVASIRDPKYAAALCATTMPEEFVDHVRGPWDALMIRLPDEELLTLTGVDGKPERVTRILAHEHRDADGDRVWSYVLEGERGTMVDRTCVPTSEMCNPVDPEENDDREHWPGLEELREPRDPRSCYANSAVDERSRHMAARIIVGVCAAFQTEGATRKLSHHSKTVRNRRRPFPTGLEFIVGRPIQVDARPYVRSYIERGGRRGPITVQSFVRGHWKWQRYGHLNEMRKFIHIEPYTRGPEDAPIAVRSHVLERAVEGSPTDRS